MLPTNASSQMAGQVQDSFLHQDSMEALKAKGRQGDPEALREVAKKFESLFIHQVLKQMRATSEVFAEDNFMRSSETKHHEQMLDQQLSLSLSSGRGLGLAEQFYQQMLNNYGDRLKHEAQTGPQAQPNSLEFSPNASRALQQVRAQTNANTTQASASELGASAPMAESPDEFVARIRQPAQAAAEKLGVPAEALVAQAVLETGWGQKVIHDAQGRSSHNLFNIKADSRWSGESVRVQTLEYRQGLAQREQADFRRYDSLEESFNDYVEFLQSSPRYREALASGDDAGAYLEELQKAGYATDPDYAQKLKRLLNLEVIQAPGLQASRPDQPNQA